MDFNLLTNQMCWINKSNGFFCCNLDDFKNVEEFELPFDLNGL